MSGSKMSLEELQARLDRPPFHRFLAMRAESVDPAAGEVVLRLPFREEFRRSAERAELHGGVTAAFVDIAGDMALVALLGRGVPTIDLRVDYLRMVGASDLVAKAKVIKAGRTIGIVDIEVHDDQGRLVALGRGGYATREG
jgi:uncharacterized protein (TIGR00369 family)